MFSDQPLYLKIKEDFLSKIREQQLKPGDKLPTEQQIMQEYQVSRITVSKALNELKEEGVLVRFPHRGTFVSDSAGISLPVKELPAPFAPSVPDQPLKEIAILLPTIKDLSSITLINGVLSVFPSDQYLCHIFRTDSPDKENIILHYCMEKEIAGIVMFPQDHAFFGDSLLAMHLKRYPMVLVDRYLPYLDTSYVISDHYAAGSLCIRHLHELGHQQFAFATVCVDLKNYSVSRRFEGMKDQIRALGLPEHSLHLITDLDWDQKPAYYQDMLLDLIIQKHVTAFITSESDLCSYLYDLLLGIGFRIPEKLSLMTFDKPSHSSQSSSFFTHIDQSEYLIGREAGILLKNRIEQQDMSVQHRIIAPTLISQTSTHTIVL